jgi:hypothetical protein
MKVAFALLFFIKLSILEAVPSPLPPLEDLFMGDANKDGRISPKEFTWPAVLFTTLDQNKDGFITQNELKALLPVSPAELKKLWAYGLISRRTGEPLIETGGEHQLNKSKVSYGHNQVLNRAGQLVRPGGRPLQGGERLILTREYQKDSNVREYAQVFTYMAPIRDALLYNFNNTTKKEWLELTQVLKINQIKTTPAQGFGPRTILSFEQVYDYIKRNPREGSPVMRFLEEAELELKCLALDPSKSPIGGGQNMSQHCEEHGKPMGSGLKSPKPIQIK